MWLCSKAFGVSSKPTIGDHAAVGRDLRAGVGTLAAGERDDPTGVDVEAVDLALATGRFPNRACAVALNRIARPSGVHSGAPS